MRRSACCPFDNVIWVDFRPDEKLGMLVPYEMKEEFFAGRFREGTGTARYTNYRQFRTGGAHHPAAAMKIVALAALALAVLAPAPTAQDVRSGLNTYLADYEPKLSELIADELMEQQNDRGADPGGGIGPPEFRTLKSEVAFIALPGDAGWMGFRRVLKVGSRAVDDTLGSLNAVLAGGAVDDYVEGTRDADRQRPVQSRHAAHDQPAESAARAPASAHTPIAFRSAWPERSACAGRKPSSWCCRERDADDHPRLRQQRHAQHHQRIRRAGHREAVAGKRDHARSAADRMAFDHMVSVEFKQDRELGLLVPATMHEEFLRRPEPQGVRRRELHELSPLPDLGANRASVS